MAFIRMKAIENKAVMIIARRMRTVAGADKIIVLSDGKVAEQGSPDAFLKKNGVSSLLFTLILQ